MNPFDTRTPPERSRGAQEAAIHNDRAQDSRPRRQTQADRILSMLGERDEVCGSEFYRAYMPRFSVAIHRLRQQGFVITKRPCDRHDWHEGGAYLYRLEALPRLLGVE